MSGWRPWLLLVVGSLFLLMVVAACLCWLLLVLDVIPGCRWLLVLVVVVIGGGC